jgi:hypothetical protein
MPDTPTPERVLAAHRGAVARRLAALLAAHDDVRRKVIAVFHPSCPLAALVGACAGPDELQDDGSLVLSYEASDALGFVRTMLPEGCAERLEDALAGLARRAPATAVVLVLVGDGALVEAIERTAAPEPPAPPDATTERALELVRRHAAAMTSALGRLDPADVPTACVLLVAADAPRWSASGALAGAALEDDGTAVAAVPYGRAGDALALLCDDAAAARAVLDGARPSPARFGGTVVAFLREDVRVIRLENPAARTGAPGTAGAGRPS